MLHFSHLPPFSTLSADLSAFTYPALLCPAGTKTILLEVRRLLCLYFVSPSDGNYFFRQGKLLRKTCQLPRSTARTRVRHMTELIKGRAPKMSGLQYHLLNKMHGSAWAERSSGGWKCRSWAAKVIRGLRPRSRWPPEWGWWTSGGWRQVDFIEKTATPLFVAPSSGVTPIWAISSCLLWPQ